MIFNKKNIILFILFLINLNLIAAEIPRPINNQLYTEYVSYKYAPYLKKPSVCEGFIAMDGKDKFIFKQTKPVEYTVKKIGDKMTYKKKNMNEIIIEADSSENNFMFLFNETISLDKEYNISEKIINDKIEFLIIPKAKSRFAKIIILVKNNAFEKLELYFADNSKIIYIFKNTTIGIKPDDKIFE